MFLLNARTIPIDFLGEVNMYLGIGIEVVLAIILAGLIGMDRESKLKSAGVKTHILICLGAMLYTAISFLNVHPGQLADPNRMPAQVISGIGFLGAGAIMQSQKRISGLTTAATIWVVAAIGVCIGSGYVITATIFSLTILFVLKLIDPFYRLVSKASKFHLEVVGVGDPSHLINPYLDLAHCRIIEEEVFMDNSGQKFIAHFKLHVNHKDIGILVSRLGHLDSIEHVKYQVLEG